MDVLKRVLNHNLFAITNNFSFSNQKKALIYNYRGNMSLRLYCDSVPYATESYQTLKDMFSCYHIISVSQQFEYLDYKIYRLIVTSLYDVMTATSVESETRHVYRRLPGLQRKSFPENLYSYAKRLL